MEHYCYCSKWYWRNESCIPVIHNTRKVFEDSYRSSKFNDWLNLPHWNRFGYHNKYSRRSIIQSPDNMSARYIELKLASHL